jgi:hypothetical protein
MPSIKRSIVLLAAVTQLALVTAAPIPQIAGVGSACNSVLTDLDNASGFATKNIEEGVGNDIKGANAKRQIAGVGSGCDSILTDLDNASGFATKNVEEGVGNDIKGANAKRQLNKISNGFGDLANDAGLSAVGNPVDAEGNVIDGDGTNGAAEVGAKIGSAEESVLEGTTATVFNKGDNTGSGGNGGSAPPPPPPPPKVRRQLNKISDGFGDLANAAGLSAVGNPIDAEGNVVDGDGTNGAAQAGADVGSAEESTLEDSTAEVFNNGDNTGSGGNGGSGGSPPPPPPPAGGPKPH